MKMNGTVKWFDVRKGFGFVSDEDGIDYFVYFSEIQGEGFKRLRDGHIPVFSARHATTVVLVLLYTISSSVTKFLLLITSICLTLSSPAA